jgi:PAS domain S-box-containing protein
LEPKQTDPKLIRSELHQAGLTPEYCFVKNLDELKAVLDADIDLVLAEYNLPASDGIEALRILRDHHLDIPLVFFSKSGGEDSIVHALKLGAADFVSTKNLSRLGPAVRRALEEKWVQRQKQASEDLIWITSRLPEENPNPVLRVDSDAVILYANPASKPLLDHWGREMGQALPAEWIRHIAAALDRGSNHEIELECGQKFFSLMLAPAVSDRCVNIFARDITADRHAAQALRNANQAIESSINAIAIGDLDGRLTHVNPSFLRMWGYSDPSEVLGRDVGEFLETEGQIRSGITTQSENRSWVGEIPARRKDGSLFDVQVSASMIIGDMGLPVGQMASFLDITARKQDAALQDAVYRIANITETTRSLSDLFQQIHVIISSVMPAENFFITLYDEKENTLRFPYFKDALDEPYINQLQPGKGLTAYVLRTGESLLCTQEVHNDLQARGEVILLGVPSAIWLGVPLVTDGKTIGVMVVQHYTDPNAYGKREQHILEFVSSQVAFAITRKQAEEALRNNEERYRALIENTSDMIAIVNPDGVVSYISPAVERVLGYEQKKVLGQSIFQIVHAEHLNAASRSMAHRARTAGLAPAAVEVRARHKNGEWRDLEVLANNLLHDPAVGGLVMNARDITERKRAQQKNLQLADRAILRGCHYQFGSGWLDPELERGSYENLWLYRGGSNRQVGLHAHAARDKTGFLHDF